MWVLFSSRDPCGLFSHIVNKWIHHSPHTLYPVLTGVLYTLEYALEEIQIGSEASISLFKITQWSKLLFLVYVGRPILRRSLKFCQMCKLKQKYASVTLWCIYKDDRVAKSCVSLSIGSAFVSECSLDFQYWYRYWQLMWLQYTKHDWCIKLVIESTWSIRVRLNIQTIAPLHYKTQRVHHLFALHLRAQ